MNEHKNYPAWVGEKPEIPESDIADIQNTDVLVLGGGHAGVQCALAAAEKGASVIVIESQKAEKYRWVGEQIGHINSKFLINMGLGPYDENEVINEFVRCSSYRADPWIIGLYVRNSGEMMDNMISLVSPDDNLLAPDQANVYQGYGNPKYPIIVGGCKTWAGTLQFRGGVVTDRNVILRINERSRLSEFERYAYRRCVELSGRWRFAEKAVVLVQENGRVTGAITKGSDGRYYKYLAAKGIALCLGNFSETGFSLGIWAGGHMEDLGIEEGAQTGTVDFSPAFGTIHFLALNKNGERFMDESSPYAFLKAKQRQPKGMITTVMDSKWPLQIRKVGLQHCNPDFGRPEYIQQHTEDMSHVLEAGAAGYAVRNMTSSEREKGLVYGAETLDKLADILGYKGTAKANWLHSIERYNQMCRAGVDSDFAKDPQTLFTIEDPPFYATKDDGRMGFVDASGAPIVPGRPRGNTKGPLGEEDEMPMMFGRGPRHHSALAGLVTDKKLNVVDSNNEPIPGLYAAGNCLGGRYGYFYPTPLAGNYIGQAMTHGRVVGKLLAEKNV